MLHARQLPLHAVAQQTPSTQLPLWHSTPRPQLTPLAFVGKHTGAAQ
jgi:hypothetical protein